MLTKLAEFLRHAGAVIMGKAAVLENLDAKAKAELSWLTWRRAVVGTVVGFLAGYICRGI